jgi:hypothetical protein
MGVKPLNKIGSHFKDVLLLKVRYIGIGGRVRMKAMIAYNNGKSF